MPQVGGTKRQKMAGGTLQKARDRLERLITVSGAEVEATRKSSQYGVFIDQAKYTAWRMSSMTVIKSLAAGSHFETEFQEFENKKLDTPSRFTAQLALLRALLDDLDGGHLSNLRGLIRAEVFGDFIDQAQHLHDQDYWQPAAVVAGAILEDHVRKLCGKHASISLPGRPKLDTMNAELAKAGEYDVLVQKRITYLADIRNKAAHGLWDKFTSADSQELIHGVLRFLTDHPL